MGIKNLFLYGLIGIIVAGGAVSICHTSKKAIDREDLESKIVVLATEKSEDKRTLAVKESIKDILIVNFLDNYLKKVTPQSDNFQKLRKKYGREGVLERYASVHELCLNLAFANQNREIGEEKYNELGKALAQKQQETSEGVSPVDNLEKNVVNAYTEWSRQKTEFFVRIKKASEKIKIAESEKLESAEKKEDYIKKLVRGAYSKEEYREYIKNFNKASDSLYEKMYQTLNLIERLFAKGEFERIAECTRKVYLGSVDEYFQDKKQEGEK